jgi:hypothetical protein
MTLTVVEAGRRHALYVIETSRPQQLDRGVVQGRRILLISAGSQLPASASTRFGDAEPSITLPRLRVSIPRPSTAVDPEPVPAVGRDQPPSSPEDQRASRHSPVMLPIPGTSKVTHLEENVAAALITLSDEQFQRLDRVSRADLSV